MKKGGQGEERKVRLVGGEGGQEEEEKSINDLGCILKFCESDQQKSAKCEWPSFKQQFKIVVWCKLF